MRTKGNPADAAWNRHGRLNTAFAEEVFGEDAAGRPVYLDLGPDVLARLAKRTGDGGAREPDELLMDVVKATLPDCSAPTRRAFSFGSWKRARRLLPALACSRASSGRRDATCPVCARARRRAQGARDAPERWEAIRLRAGLTP